MPSKKGQSAKATYAMLACEVEPLKYIGFVMTLTELRYITTLAREKHFGKAALVCHVSQPTLSVAIHKLEVELGLTIFERHRHEVRITDLGKEIIAQAQHALDEVATIKVIAQKGQSQLTTPLRVGAIYTIAPYLLPHLIPKLKKMAPHMPLFIHEDFTANLRVKLQQAELDAIFISFPFSESSVTTQALYDEPFVVLMPKEHPLSQKASVTFNDIAKEEVLLLGKGHCFRDQVIEICPTCLSENGAQKTIEGTSLDTLRHMVASGMGITILPSTATQIQFYKSILCTRPFKGKVPKRTVALAWRSGFTRPEAIQMLIQALHASMLHNGICLLPE
jgi:LysR family hydrogen peroxide-inducible transcriptional activator